MARCGWSAMRAEVGVDVGDHLVDENMLERRVGHGESPSSPGSARAGPPRPAAPGAPGLTGRGRPATAARPRHGHRRPRRLRDIAIGDHDEEWLGFAFRDQVVHDQAGVALPAPAVFIFTRAVLQIQHRIALRSFS